MQSIKKIVVNLELKIREEMMMQQMRWPEVLAPAGDFECFQAAVRFGADAVYLGGARFGMRASSATFYS